MARQTTSPPRAAARTDRRWAAALAVAFLSGWCVMMLEILAGRLLAPYFGFSIFAWGALIGVVLGFMAAGYFLGGRVGESPRAPKVLAASIGLSIAWVLITPALGGTPLAATRAFGPAWGAVLGSALLLGVPSFLLATVSPIVAGQSLRRGVARAAGTVYGVSTLGSIGGTFFAAFVAIPWLGSKLSYYVAAALLGVAAAFVLMLWRERSVAAPLVALVAGVLLFPHDTVPALYKTESIHNIIRVEDHPDSRMLYLNYRAGPQTVMPKQGILGGSYYDYFILAPLLSGGHDVLFLGVAGGAALRQITATDPAAKVVGVDLDPAVLDVARDYFGLAQEPRIALHADDARWYVSTTSQQFDAIAEDLYVTGSIPFFCTTVEFFRTVADRLKDNGVFMMNVLSIQPGDDLIGPMVRTARQAFGSVYLINHGNYILLATKSPTPIEELRRRLRSASIPEVRQVADRALGSLREPPDWSEYPVFTDDLNDVEFRSFRMFYGYY